MSIVAQDRRGSSGQTRNRGKAKTRKPAQDFYATALEEAEQVALEAARELEGLDEEIALLRVKLHSSLAQQPQNVSLLLRGMELLVRAVAARYRISGKSEEDLYQNAVGVLKGIGELLLPEEHTRGG